MEKSRRARSSLTVFAHSIIFGWRLSSYFDSLRKGVTSNNMSFGESLPSRIHYYKMHRETASTFSQELHQS